MKNTIFKLKYEKHESHIGSAITAVEIIRSIFEIMDEGDKFILSAGHAGMALYVVLEEKGLLPKGMSKELGLHPVRNEKYHIWASTGSLGHGLPIALGMALANPDRKYWVLLSDGECMEGSVFESLRLAALTGVQNLGVFVNVNGWVGYDAFPPEYLKSMINGFQFPVVMVNTNSDFDGGKGLAAHYAVQTKENYEKNVR